MITVISFLLLPPTARYVSVKLEVKVGVTKLTWDKTKHHHGHNNSFRSTVHSSEYQDIDTITANHVVAIAFGRAHMHVGGICYYARCSKCNCYVRDDIWFYPII